MKVNLDFNKNNVTLPLIKNPRDLNMMTSFSKKTLNDSVDEQHIQNIYRANQSMMENSISRDISPVKQSSPDY